MPKTLALDFDGVLSDYHGWRGEAHLDPPRPGVQAFLRTLKDQGYRLVIHTTRGREQIIDWLLTHQLDDLIYDVTRTKPPAWCTIDDRAICFTGDYAATLEALATFRVYWEEADDGDAPT